MVRHTVMTELQTFQHPVQVRSQWRLPVLPERLLKMLDTIRFPGNIPHVYWTGYSLSW